MKEKKRNSVVAGKVVVVVVKALKEIPSTALVWALTHVVQPGDYIKLLAVVPSHTSMIWQYEELMNYEFCSEVEVLSCAQHRNVVMLIGFCVEDGRRLLVYEYICNGSLDSHLYGKDKPSLKWFARQRIAVGATRGLRYLHEECRVGCIVHRDMRPNNILLTHDFEPLVGDFGLARWQPDGDIGMQTRVIGTFGSFIFGAYIRVWIRAFQSSKVMKPVSFGLCVT